MLKITFLRLLIVVTLSSAQPHPSGMINSIMFALQETISMPLVITKHGTIRIKGSRVSLDSIVHHFKLGATAEQFVQSFPSLSLGDVYSSIAYYLTHRQEIEEYLQEQETAADVLQEQLESNPETFSPNVMLRPIVQDWLLPTVAYIGGPAEIAYFGQLRPLYQFFGRIPPIVMRTVPEPLRLGPQHRHLRHLPRWSRKRFRGHPSHR